MSSSSEKNSKRNYVPNSPSSDPSSLPLMPTFNRKLLYGNFGMNPFVDSKGHKRASPSLLVNPRALQRSLSDMTLSSRMSENQSTGINSKVLAKSHNRKKSYEMMSMTLYIQMELCTTTLHHWLLDRNNGSGSVDWPQNINIFKQILCGVAYVHGQGLIHRDLKPRNLFISSKPNKKDLHIKIGDFGLARRILYEQSNGSEKRVVLNSSNEENKFSHIFQESAEKSNTKGVGTFTYAAPEQLDNKRYDKKADMYSLGIILFELFYPITTQMERLHNIEQIRKGSLCQSFIDEWVDEADLVKQLTQLDPKQRPTAEEVLVMPIFADKDQVISRLQRRMLEKDEEISKLKELLNLQSYYQCPNCIQKSSVD